MMLVLVSLIFIIIKIILQIIYYTIKAIVKICYYLFKFIYAIFNVKFLRIPLLILTIGYFLRLKFIFLSTIYFLYLMHLCAIKFNIYKEFYIDLKYIYNKFISYYKISNSLKVLKKDNIVLTNLFLESNKENSCLIDNLVITNDGLFLIKSPVLSYNDYLNNSLSFEKVNINNYNEDKIIDNNLLVEAYKDCLKCYSVLREIFSEDISITNIIALPQNNLVVMNSCGINIPIVTLNELCYFIQKNLSTKPKYSPLILKETLLQNKMWYFDIFFSKLKSFFIHSKFIILFFLTFFIIYEFYITILKYFFFKVLKLLL